MVFLVNVHSETSCVSEWKMATFSKMTKNTLISNFINFKFYKFQILNFYKNVMSKNLPWVPWVPWMCPKHGNLRCQLSIVLSVDCPEICPESQNMCPKHGNLRCRMKCALRLPWKIKICPETALRAHFALSMEIFGGWLMMIRYFFMDIGEIVT